MARTRKFDDFLNEAYKRKPSLKDDVRTAEAYLDIALRIRQLRTADGLTQNQLAEKIGTDQGNVAKWETPGYTDYTLKTLQKLAEALNVRVSVELTEQSIKTTVKEAKFSNIKNIFSSITELTASQSPTLRSVEYKDLKNA